MDSLVASAPRLLAAGDPFGALKRVALRDDPPALAARDLTGRVHALELTRAELALRRIRVADAAVALDRAHAAAVIANIPALAAEIGRARCDLSAPSARLIRAGVVRIVRLNEVETLFASRDLIVDGCRRLAPRTHRLNSSPCLKAASSGQRRRSPAQR